MTFLSCQTARSKILTLLYEEKIIGFFLIGICSTLIDIGLLYLFTEYVGFWYIYSATFSYTCGLIVNFLLNKYLNFRDTNRHYIRQFFSFVLISMISLGLSLGIIYVAVEIFFINYLLGKIFAVIIAFFWNYFCQSKITFRFGTYKMSGDLREYVK